MTLRSAIKIPLNIPDGVERFYTNAMKATIGRLYEAETLSSRYVLTGNLKRINDTLDRLEQLLRDDFREGIDKEKVMQTRNGVLGEAFFDPKYPFQKIENLSSRLMAKGVLDSLVCQDGTPSSRKNSKQLYSLSPKWKAPIADLVIGCAAFPETSVNAALGCQKHADTGHLIGDSGCAGCFRSALHRLASDAFNHYFMHRCITCSDTNGVASNFNRGDAHINLMSALERSPLCKRVSQKAQKRTLGFGSKKMISSTNPFLSLQSEFLTYAMNHLASGWTWVAYNLQSNEICVVNTPNNGSVLSYGMWPLVAIDLWEHAFLSPSSQKDSFESPKRADAVPCWTRESRRAKQGLPPLSSSNYTQAQEQFIRSKKKYIEKFWLHIDWDFVEDQVKKALAWQKKHADILIAQDARTRDLSVSIRKLEASQANANISSHQEDGQEHDLDEGALKETEGRDHEELGEVQGDEPSVSSEQPKHEKSSLSDSVDKAMISENLASGTKPTTVGGDVHADDQRSATQASTSDLTEEDLWSEIYEKSFSESDFFKNEKNQTKKSSQHSRDDALGDTLFDFENDADAPNEKHKKSSEAADGQAPTKD